jgi:hypothetical protein
MAVRQLSSRLPAALLQLRQAGKEGLLQQQQQCAQEAGLLHRFMAGLRHDAQRSYSQAFQPSRLYPKQRQSSDAVAFWGIIGMNTASAFLAKSDKPEVPALIAQHFTTSVAAVSEGRWYTLLTSSLVHTSMVHCVVNLLMLMVYRRTQPLRATEVWALHCACCC